MKIAFINIYQESVDRGVETFVDELSHRLAKKHQVKIFSGGKLVIPQWHMSFLWRFFLDANSLAIAKFTLKNIPQIWREKYDIVIPINGGWQPAILRIVTWLYGGKLVISGQSGRGWHERNNLWCFPNVFVALSTQAESWARRVNPFVKVVSITNGVDTKKFKKEGEQISFFLKKPIILCVAALSKTKRVDLVIRAVAEMKDASLLVVGKGEENENLEKLGKELLGERFEINSFSYEDMPKVYRSVNLFTLVSEPYYSFENVLVEAMASGLGVVANNDAIRREIVSKAGILVDPENIQTYSDSLRKALQTNWGDQPRRQALKFDWDKIAQKYEKLISETT